MNLLATRRALLLGSLLLITACQSAKLALPPGFEAQALTYPVSGRGGLQWQQQLQFGPYQTGKVQRDWDRSESVEISGYRQTSTKGGFRFSIRDPNNAIEAQCQERADAEDIDLDARPDQDLKLIIAANSHLQCTLHTRDTLYHLLLSADASIGEIPQGMVYSAGDSYLIRRSDRMEGSDWDVSGMGYLVLRGSTVTAAVEVVNAGRFFVSRHLAPDTALLMAATGAALLLYRVPER